MLHGGPRAGVAYWPVEGGSTARARIGWDFAIQPSFVWQELVLELGPDEVAVVPSFAIATPHALIFPSPAARVGFPLRLGPTPAVGIRLEASVAIFMAEFSIAYNTVFGRDGREGRASLIIDLSI